jgi:hypothetical protein
VGVEISSPEVVMMIVVVVVGVTVIEREVL